ncbi:hypothetical protein [Rosenbergiella nectarea]|uniref:hypothetical protein n=1 Tax=Rosenbergiella nectarea TaxID=988801 RepID=UPI001E32CF75|nr:hypothetical protein [Rosenbergiella nectarea]
MVRSSIRESWVKARIAVAGWHPERYKYFAGNSFITSILADSSCAKLARSPSRCSQTTVLKPSAAEKFAQKMATFDNPAKTTVSGADSVMSIDGS